jgi:hypothetical protein
VCDVVMTEKISILSTIFQPIILCGRHVTEWGGLTKIPRASNIFAGGGTKPKKPHDLCHTKVKFMFQLCRVSRKLNVSLFFVHPYSTLFFISMSVPYT